MGIVFLRSLGMSGIKLGQYIYGTSLLHRLDPRTKIISCLILVISVLLNFGWYYLLFLLALVMLAIIYRIFSSGSFSAACAVSDLCL
jgi:energy-coupling factor transporter transmembrane protein EcfT